MKKEIATLVRRAKQSLAKSDEGESQQILLRNARKELGLTNRELAEALGLTIGKDDESAALLAWLAPATAAKHRTMPRDSRLLLERILKEQRARRAKR